VIPLVTTPWGSDEGREPCQHWATVTFLQWCTRYARLFTRMMKYSPYLLSLLQTQ